MKTRTLHISSIQKRRQLGAVSLFVALVLLLGGTIIAFFANRGFIFEQRTSANQYRSTKAFELAEAGSEWALGKLNEKMLLTSATSCAPAAAATGASNTFQERYANPQPGCAGGVGCYVPSGVLMGCRISAAGVTNCECPSATAAILTTNPDEGRFGVRIRGGGDPTTLEIFSRGCTNGTAACDPDADSSAESTAVVRFLAKVVPAVPSGPAAALTTGSATVTGGNMYVVNNDQASNGITIHAGTTVNLTGSTNVYSLPGTPPRASILDNDPTLADLTNASADAFFANYFQEKLSDYRNRSDVVKLGPNETGANIANRCTSAGACGDRIAVIAALEPNKSFYVEGNVSFNGGTIGAPAGAGRPGNSIILVAAPLANGTGGDIELRGGVTAYGLFYSASATASENWDWTGSGGATIYGAFISRGNFDNASGNMRLIYDPSLWNGPLPPVGTLVRVPGSWRDKATTF